jgi:secreted trypsin-like serine protease
MIVSANRFDLQKSTLEDDGVDFRVLQFELHPQYSPDDLTNDIALLQIAPLPGFEQNMRNLVTVPIDATNAGLNKLPEAVQQLRRDLKAERDARDGSSSGQMRLNPLFAVSGLFRNSTAPATGSLAVSNSTNSSAVNPLSTNYPKKRKRRRRCKPVSGNRTSTRAPGSRNRTCSRRPGSRNQTSLRKPVSGNRTSIKNELNQASQPVQSNAVSSLTKVVDKESQEGIINTGIQIGITPGALEQANKLALDIQQIDQRSTINDQFFAAGFGATQRGGRPSATLERVQMKMAKASRCQQSGLLRGPIKPESIVCAVGADFRSNTCQGDSGGPMYTDDGQRQTLVGLMSFGKGCIVSEQGQNGQTLGVPGIRTRVFFHRQFIADTIAKFRSA